MTRVAIEKEKLEAAGNKNDRVYFEKREGSNKKNLEKDLTSLVDTPKLINERALISAMDGFKYFIFPFC